jgi:hypothetical protein
MAAFCGAVLAEAQVSPNDHAALLPARACRTSACPRHEPRRDGQLRTHSNRTEAGVRGLRSGREGKSQVKPHFEAPVSERKAGQRYARWTIRSRTQGAETGCARTQYNVFPRGAAGAGRPTCSGQQHPRSTIDR